MCWASASEFSGAFVFKTILTSRATISGVRRTIATHKRSSYSQWDSPSWDAIPNSDLGAREPLVASAIGKMAVIEPEDETFLARCRCGKQFPASSNHKFCISCDGGLRTRPGGTSEPTEETDRIIVRRIKEEIDTEHKKRLRINPDGTESIRPRLTKRRDNNAY